MITEHIYTPADNSFEARLTSLKRVLEAFRNVERSLNLADDPEWSNQLGSPEEVQNAHTLIKNSLDAAISDINTTELQQAKTKKLLSKEEIASITVFQRQQEIKSSRSESKSGLKTDHKQ